jgi:hypothetical protein
MDNRTKYKREIPTDENGLSEIYDVLVGFDVRCPAVAHAIKKLLCAGKRGDKSESKDS